MSVSGRRWKRERDTYNCCVNVCVCVCVFWGGSKRRQHNLALESSFLWSTPPFMCDEHATKLRKTKPAEVFILASQRDTLGGIQEAWLQQREYMLTFAILFSFFYLLSRVFGLFFHPVFLFRNSFIRDPWPRWFLCRTSNVFLPLPLSLFSW